MKILFFISVHGQGRGGHYHSLNHISRKLGEFNEVKIVTIGPQNSAIIESNPYFHSRIYFNGFNLLSLEKNIRKIKNKFRPDIYHCFDNLCYNIIRVILSSRRNKIILNLCGGPNPLRFPFVKNLILFSVENKNWFEHNNKFENTNIYLIPNRVKALTVNSDFCPIEKDKDCFIFMRICRIGETYKKSIYDSINLIRLLNSKNIYDVKLYVIGAIYDASVFEKLMQNDLVIKGVVTILIDSKITIEASKVLYLADAVIGTGRGLMEATSLNKPVLAIDKNGEIPILINKLNFNNAFKTNFSERNVFKSIDVDNNMDNILKLITDKQYYKELAKFSFDSFNEYFNLEKIQELYSNVYLNSEYSKRALSRDFLLISRSILTFWRSSKNNLKSNYIKEV